MHYIENGLLFLLFKKTLVVQVKRLKQNLQGNHESLPWKYAKNRKVIPPQSHNVDILVSHRNFQAMQNSHKELISTEFQKYWSEVSQL